MGEICKEELEKIYSVFYQDINNFLNSKSDVYVGEVCIWSESVDNNEINHTVITFFNDILKKKVKISFVYNNLYGRIYSNIEMKNENNDLKFRNSFSVKDYYSFKNKSFPAEFKTGSLLLQNLFWRSFSDYITRYYYFTCDFFVIEEIQKILYTEYWTDVPIDFSPYK